MDTVKPLEPWQQRLVGEKEFLDANLDKLRLFINSTKFDGLHAIEKSLLLEQAQHMKNYSNILEARIDRFTRGE